MASTATAVPEGDLLHVARPGWTPARRGSVTTVGPGTADDVTTTPEELVDLVRYPVDDPGSEDYRQVVVEGRRRLGEVGAAELPGFVTPAGVAALVADADSLASRAHRSGGRGTAYLEAPDGTLPAGHPRLVRGEYRLGVVAYDLFPRSSPLRVLYEWPPLTRLVGDLLGRGTVHPYADPFGALNLAVMGEGDRLQWHFDQTDFVVSLALQTAERGGDFEVVPFLRRAGDQCYDDVAAVLGGDRSRVRTLPMTPGTLLVFEGRNSLHRVSPVVGPTARHVGLLAYDTTPGTMGSDLLRHDRYGRTVPFDEPPVSWSGRAAGVVETVG